MRTFDENLNAYHGLNAINDIYEQQMGRKLKEAKTLEEIDAIVAEVLSHSVEQSKLYRDLGEEMAKIMEKKWWQFWKG